MLVDYSKFSRRVFYAGKIYNEIPRATLMRRLETGPLEVIVIHDYFLEGGLYNAHFETVSLDSRTVQFNLIRFFILEDCHA